MASKHERHAAELERRATVERERAEAAEAAAREQALRTEDLIRSRDTAERRAEAAEAASERHELRARELQKAVEAASAAKPAQAPAATRHLLFVQAGARYELLERDGAPPIEGDEVELDEARFVVTKLGRSPLARDARPCAYLQAAA